MEKQPDKEMIYEKPETLSSTQTNIKSLSEIILNKQEELTADDK